MTDLDAKRYQYLKDMIKGGYIEIDGGVLTAQNTNQWDELIDDHLNRLAVDTEYKKGQVVYVCSLNKEQPLWLKQSSALIGEVLDSWLGKQSNLPVYKVKLTHNNAIDEYKDHCLLPESVFNNVAYPEWVNKASSVMSKIRLEINPLISANRLVSEIVELVRTEKQDRYGDVEVEAYCSNPYINISVRLNKNITYFRNHTRTNKNALIFELNKVLNQ